MLLLNRPLGIEYSSDVNELVKTPDIKVKFIFSKWYVKMNLSIQVKIVIDSLGKTSMFRKQLEVDSNCLCFSQCGRLTSTIGSLLFWTSVLRRTEYSSNDFYDTVFICFMLAKLISLTYEGSLYGTSTILILLNLASLFRKLLSSNLL